MALDKLTKVQSVGISSFIQVVGVVTATGGFVGDLTGNVTGNITGTTSNASGATGDFSIADKIVHTGDTNTALRFPAADTITAETGGSERFKVTDSLKEVKNGNLRITSTYIDFSGDISTPTTAAAIFRPADNTLAFSTGNNERLRITSSGDIGIGDNAPNSSYGTNLSVHSTTTDGARIKISDGTSGKGNVDGLDIVHQSGIAYFIQRENNDMRFYTNSTERLRISNIGQLTTKGSNQGNPVGIEIRNNNTNAYSHAELSLTSQNATTSKIWCDVPNSGMRLNYNGGTSVKIDQSGNLVMGNGAGIDFSATSDASGMSSEVLDDYEEGSFSPTITWGGTSATLSGSTYGYYTKIGNTVIINFRITQTARNTTSGSLRMQGLPFAEGSSAAYNHGMVQGDAGINMPSTAGSIMIYIENSNHRFLYQTPTGHADLDASHCADGTSWYGFATYFTS